MSDCICGGDGFGLNLSCPTHGPAECGGVQTKADEQARVVAQACVKRARQGWGKGWDRLSPEQQQNAISSEIVQVLLRAGSCYTLEFLRGVTQWAYHAMEE